MADPVKVIFHNVREFETAVTGIDRRVQFAAKAAGATAGKELAVAAAVEAPHGKTGKLAGSMRSIETRVDNQPVVMVGPTTVYGRRVDLGFKGKTKAGKQRRKKVLSNEIFGPSGKGVRVGWSVRGLQPTKPNRFLERALVASHERIAETYKKAWRRALTK